MVISHGFIQHKRLFDSCCSEENHLCSFSAENTIPLIIVKRHFLCVWTEPDGMSLIGWNCAQKKRDKKTKRMANFSYRDLFLHLAALKWITIQKLLFVILKCYGQSRPSDSESENERDIAFAFAFGLGWFIGIHTILCIFLPLLSLSLQ